MKVLIATCNNLVTLIVVLLCKRLLLGVCDEIARQCVKLVGQLSCGIHKTCNVLQNMIR